MAAAGTMTPNQARQISHPLERQRVALGQIESARETWKAQARDWWLVRAEAVLELRWGRTWAQVAELLGVSEPTAWNIAHPRWGGSQASPRHRRGGARA
jgi:Homeodomain-like domain